jgi:hypothetical protein
MKAMPLVDHVEMPNAKPSMQTTQAQSLHLIKAIKEYSSYGHLLDHVAPLARDASFP